MGPRGMMRLFIAIGVWVLLTLLNQGAYGSPSSGRGTGTVSKNAAAVAAHMDELWRARRAGHDVHELIAVGVDPLASDPEYEITWRVSRARWWLARTEPEPTRRAALAHDAMEWAERARAQNDARVEGHFMYATAVGEYGASIGVARALCEGIASKFKRAALAAYERDPDFDHGGPMLALGRYYYVLPWPLRDLEKSRRYLEELRQRHPRTLLGRFWLAETYLALGEREQARAELEFVLATVETAPRLVGYEPKILAREVLAQAKGSDHGA